MLCLIPVAPSVTVLRGIAASDGPADETGPEMHPPVTGRHTLVADVGFGVDRIHPDEMITSDIQFWCHLPTRN